MLPLGTMVAFFWWTAADSNCDLPAGFQTRRVAVIASSPLLFSGRESWIRTRDPLFPKQIGTARLP